MDGRSPRLVYGIVPAGSGVEPAVSGVTVHRGFDVVEHRRVGALASIVPGPFDATPDDLRAHLAVLDDVMERTTVLPMRFGVVLDSPRAVIDELLAPGESLFADLLSRMRGLVEMRVRAVYREDQVLAEILRDHPELRRRHEALRGLPQDATYFERIELGRSLAEAMSAKARRDAQWVHQRVAELALDVSPGEPPAERRVTTASFLVRRRDTGSFVREVERIAKDAGGVLDIRAVGPMPPFSFVDLQIGTLDGASR